MATLRITDDLGRALQFTRPPARVVSVVPSDTFTLVALGLVDRLVGRTSYCDVPEAAAAIVVGGTKDFDVEAVLALAPDLVIANQEENTRRALEKVAERVPVLVSLPRTVDQAMGHVARLARIFGGVLPPAGKQLVRDGYAEAQRAVPGNPIRAFTPIWDDPLMTISGDTYGSDVMARAGLVNVFADRTRSYPLSADLGRSLPDDAGLRDIRYPRITEAELQARAPELILLPDEPYRWPTDAEARFAALCPGARVIRVSGRDLFWSGAHGIGASARLAHAARS